MPNKTNPPKKVFVHPVHSNLCFVYTFMDTDNPFCFSVCIPSVLNGAANSVSLSSSPMAVSLATCFQNIGMALCPYVVNAVGFSIFLSTDASFSINQGALITGICILFAIAIVFGFINSREVKQP